MEKLLFVSRIKVFPSFFDFKYEALTHLPLNRYLLKKGGFMR